MPLTECCHLWNFLFIEDAARALVALLDTGCEDGIYNVASKTTTQLRDFVLQACALFPGSSPPRFGNLPYGLRGPLSLQPSVQKLMRNTGWVEQVSFAEGLRQTWASINHRPINTL